MSMIERSRELSRATADSAANARAADARAIAVEGKGRSFTLAFLLPAVAVNLRLWTNQERFLESRNIVERSRDNESSAWKSRQIQSIQAPVSVTHEILHRCSGVAFWIDPHELKRLIFTNSSEVNDEIGLTV